MAPALLAAAALALAGVHAEPADDVTVAFNATFSSHAVLQQAPAKAAVYGMVSSPWMVSAPVGSDGAEWPAVAVTVSGGAGGAYTVAAVVDHVGGNVWKWKALLHPTAAGGGYRIEASMNSTSGANSTAIDDVTFGDVWYCAGQSNMWLPLKYTFQRNDSVAAIHAGKYDNIRLMAGDSQRGVAYPWVTAKGAIADGNATVPDYSLFKFSAVCYYFAESLTDAFRAAGKEPPVLGLINTAIGGSMIEEWTLNATTDTCANASRGTHDQTLYDKNVRPYLGMTLKGWLWYQGENNCHGVMGNAAQSVGYGCQLPAMVSLWRKEWSVESGTTDPAAPFGVVTLASGGSEGGSDIGGMRWSQTANYGELPNAAMPNTFLAQAYDLGDPWGDKTCYGWQCCWNNYNATTCAANAMKRLGAGPEVCDTYCSVLRGTPVYMGGIHPRIKKPVGDRLAKAAMGVVYSGAGATTGPTISACAVRGGDLTVTFDGAALRGDKVVVQEYNTTPGYEMSAFQVLTNRSFFCQQPMLRCHLCGDPRMVKAPECLGPDGTTRLPNATRPARCGSPRQEWFCPAGLGPVAGWLPPSPFSLGAPEVGGVPPRNPYENPPAWVTVNVTSRSATEVTADLRALGGVPPVAVRYAWGNTRDSCCANKGDALIGISKPCKAAACPIMSSSDLPANPFLAMIVDGKCRCLAPQKCSGDIV